MGEIPRRGKELKHLLLTLFSILSITTSVHSQIVGADAKCFFLSGREAKDYVPCNPESTVSSCCLRNEFCLSNKLCWGGTIGVAYRGGCTDFGWTSSECPQQCRNDGYTDGWSNIVSCGDGSMACAPDWGNSTASPCTVTKNRFAWNQTAIIPLVAGAANLGNRSTAIPTQSPAQISTTQPQATQCNGTVGATHIDSSAANRTAIAAGLGTGIPLLALSLALAAALIAERRKRLATDILLRDRTSPDSRRALGSSNGLTYIVHNSVQNKSHSLYEADDGRRTPELSS